MTRYAIVACVLLLVLGWGTDVASAQEQIGIQVSPSTINLAYQGTVVTVHADIPYRGVITASLRLNGVEVWYTKADARGDLVAKFHVASVKNIVAPPSATLTLVGMVETIEEDPVSFSGTDTVRVIDQSGQR
jgi:hypothetical protein